MTIPAPPVESLNDQTKPGSVLQARGGPYVVRARSYDASTGTVTLTLRSTRTGSSR